MIDDGRLFTSARALRHTMSADLPYHCPLGPLVPTPYRGGYKYLGIPPFALAAEGSNAYAPFPVVLRAFGP